jgi:hypothetical protein
VLHRPQLSQLPALHCFWSGTVAASALLVHCTLCWLPSAQDKAVGALSDAMGTFEEQVVALKDSYEARLAALSAEIAAEERERHSQGLIAVSTTTC